ncbi:head maturation protease, ClpP-related [Caldifermentibacillus hisashii]|uniref:head maturation protease, ClpP-related n=1 Tax=Caldifermentibacillus hisashii TaxID=996558 RepID=UPI0031FBCD65
MKKRFKNEKYNSLPKIDKVFKAEALDEDSAKLIIYGDIGESWWGDYITASDVERVLKDLTTNTLHVHINSYGGDVFEGIAIYNLLKNHKAKVVIHIDGVAASAASLIAMAGDDIISGTGAMIMVHEAWTYAYGNKTDIQKVLNSLIGIDKSIVDIYMTRFTGNRSEMETFVRNETWFTSDEALEFGLVDKVTNDTQDDDETDPDDFKNSVLERIRAKKANENNNILNKFKRQV